MKQEQPRKLSVDLDEKGAGGTYSNFVLITHNQSEFLIDFARVLPGVPKAKVYSRIIMTPQHVKSLEKVLTENIKKYEDKFGTISIKGQEQKNIGFHPGFKPEE